MKSDMRSPFMKSRSVLTCAALLALFLVAPAGASQPSAKVERPSGVSGTVVVPDQFLRRWDPVTIFFGSDVGPSKGGAEDDPGEHVTMKPEHPGAFTWLDGRTLQFRPAEPWPPLERFEWSLDGRTYAMTTLMSAPVATQPSAGQTGLDPVPEIVLTFSEPMEPAALARMVQVELKALPGVGSGAKSRWLDSDDFQVKALERRNRSDNAGYSLALNTPIPLGVRAVVHLRLSLDDASSESIVQIPFATDEPFRIAAVGCRALRLPVTAEGSSYAAEQALRCDGPRTVVVDFSATPRSLGPIEGRNLVRFSPAVDGLSFNLMARTLEVSGSFKPETVYRVTLAPTTLADEKGRTLQMTGESEVFLYFPKSPAFLSWRFNQGVVERFGPQMLPLEGRGQDRLDLRIHKIDALDRDFWPFPRSPVGVDESRQPPGPGEEPEKHVATDAHISPSQLSAQIHSLGTPQVSSIVDLPLKRDGRSATFGLDVSKDLAFISGKEAPGTYLVGIRRLDAGNTREWQRIQVTDLSLSTVEETEAVTFAVTSLASGKPVSGASIKVEGGFTQKGMRTWETLLSGTTGGNGRFTWKHRAPLKYSSPRVMRIVVAKGEDVLVLDPLTPPDGFTDNQWRSSYETWLQWTQTESPGRAPAPESLTHLFTERPVYRPDEVVHIKGWVRRRHKGELSPLDVEEPQVVVTGPGDLAWNYKVSLTALGGFDHDFSEQDLPTGTYSAWLKDRFGARFGFVTFQVEAYRLPTFEVNLHGPDRTPLDKEFAVSLSATYYAGGRVVGRPVRWRVTQFPYTWVPERREGFLYSSDGRFSNAGGFESRGTVETETTTDENGTAKLPINPAIEPTSAPRTYVVEATVVGDDDQTVSGTRSVVALPPFVLGLKAPRYVEKAKAAPRGTPRASRDSEGQQIEPEVLVVGVDGKPIAGQKVTVRLLSRQWHSHLTASDFSEGTAKYVTDVVDKKLTELEVVSGTQPKKVELALPRAGVYLVELESRDSLGRAQVVTVDLYAGGDEPVTWTKPQGQVFQVATDKAEYVPGDVATLVLKSPFQKGQALAIVEAPDGNRYDWVEVKNGAATFKLPLSGNYTPRVPVHFVLQRGRVQGSAPVPGSETDFGKPQTLASTTWLEVKPVDNRVEVKLEHPERAQPGDTVKLTVKLTTPQGKPVSGEVALWLVDQAVLALGTEQRLDPLPDFITGVQSRLTVRDTRGFVIGWLPLTENPGGDGAEAEESKSSQESLLDKVTIRKKFVSVPYWEPALRVPSSGVLTVSVQLPDNLTNFKVRAKAASGNGRFGFGTGTIAVRLPLIVQPALPRFVRPGDRFAAAAIGRVVEGPGGAGRVEFALEGMKPSGDVKQSVTWTPDKPSRLEVPVEVLTPPYTADGRLSKEEVVFRAAVERTSDKARDAVEIRLPLREDRWPVVDRAIAELEMGKPMKLPPVKEAARPGTVKRTVLLSDQAALVKMAAGLDFLLSYPYGGTEQRIARARGMLATKKFRELLHQESASDARLKKEVEDTLAYLESVVDTNGLVSYWPGSRGYVSLTAWTLLFLQDAKEAGFKVNEKTEQTLIRTLEQALRSDYARFIDGEAYMERAWALTALAAVGRFDASYASELARKAKFLDQEGLAEVLMAYARQGKAKDALAQDLEKELFEAIVFRLWQGREIYGGLQTRVSSRNALILPSETRTVAESMRALAAAKTPNPRLQVLTDALVTLGTDDGWGSTNADAAALLALSEVLEAPFPGAQKHEAVVTFGTKQETVKTGPENPVGYVVSSETAEGEVTLGPGGASKLVARAETTYMPLADGSHVAQESRGFVVSRELMKVMKDAPPVRTRLEKPGMTMTFAVGDVIEEHVQIVNPKQRHYVAVVVPLAAGMEPLNPALATAPPEAKASGSLTLQPSYVAFLDDKLAYFYDVLPQGTYDFYFRTRAQIPGSFIQPAAQAEMMYDAAVRGNSSGARIEVSR